MTCWVLDFCPCLPAADGLLYFCNDRNVRQKKGKNMNWLLTTYVAYLVISIALTVWVARTLHKNGRVFLVDSFLGNEQLADSVNHLLVVGFYLINIGYVSLALKHAASVSTAQAALETLSSKIGFVLLVL